MFAVEVIKRTILLRSTYLKVTGCTLLRLPSCSKHTSKITSFTFFTRRYCSKYLSSSYVRGIYRSECRYKSVSQNNEVTELLNQIELDVRDLQRVNYEDAKQLLNFLERGMVECEKYSLLLMEWCGRLIPEIDTSTRISFANSILKGLQESENNEIKTQHYNALLKCYALNNHRLSVAKFLEEMGSVIPDNSTYDLLLECCCVVGDLEQSMCVIELMKDKKIPANETTFNSLIIGYARAGDIKKSLSVLDTMIAANLSPSSNTYTALLQSYAEIGDFENLKKFYMEAIFNNLNINVLQLMSVFRVLALRNHYVVMPKFLGLLSGDLLKFTSPIQNIIIELLHSKYKEAASLLMMSVLSKVDFSPEQPCVFFVTEMCRAKIEPAYIISICNDLEHKELCPRALYIAAEVSFKQGEVELSLNIFETLHKNNKTLRPHFFWPLFKLRSKTDGEKGIMNTLKNMQILDVIPDFYTLLDYVLPVISTSNPETTIQKLKACGISVRQSLTPVAAFFLLKKRFQLLLRLCEMYPTKVDFEKLLPSLVEAFVSSKCTVEVVLFLKYISKHSKNDLAGQFILELLTINKSRYNQKDILQLLQSFKKEDICISSFASDVLCQYFKNGSPDSSFSQKEIGLLADITQPELHVSSAETSTYIVHPRDMNIEQLESHLLELKSKNMNTRGILRRLLQSHLQKGNVKRVLEVKKELEESGFAFSPGMLASMFAAYICLKDSKSAENILNELMQNAPNFILDDHKIIDFAALLVSENQYKVAVTVLEKQAASGHITGGANISHNCWRLLNILASKGEPEKVKHMLHLLNILGFCSKTNTLLGPIVRGYLVRGDIEGAVKEFKKYALEMRKTPLQLELITHLAGKNSSASIYQTSLNETLAATSSVHGEGSALATYAVALAECHKKKELQNLVAENGSKINYKSLINNAERLAKENKLASLAILADTCAALPNFHTPLIYNLMLQVLDKQGDCDRALKLWIEMQEKDVQPTSYFLSSLASILRHHKKPVPFAVPNT